MQFLQLVLGKIIEHTPENKLLKMMNAFVKAIMDMHEGQAMDIYFRDNQIVPTLDEYR